MAMFTSLFCGMRHKSRGSLLISILVLGTVAMTIVTTGIAAYALFEHRASSKYALSDEAFTIAEAGVNYYRWHLAHDPTDYEDGTEGPGPYVHEYRDKDGNVIGYYSLSITPPLAGSTVVMIESTGWTVADPNTRRTIRVRVGFPSLTDYTFLSNANMNFGASTRVYGTVQSNGGIRFDGTTDSWVRSAVERYTYLTQTHEGVWGSGGPRSFWEYPVPAIDFNTITTDLATLRDAADEAGVHLVSSGVYGWHIVFSGSTYSLYRVNSLSCYNGEGQWRRNRSGWYWDGATYCYDIQNQTLVSANQPIPENGTIFSDDHVWVDGTVNGRVTVAVGRFPVVSPYRNIYINNNLLYDDASTSTVIGLLAQGDIIVPHNVPTDMSIDAAMLSQFGSIYHPYYDNHLRNSLTIFGSQISYNGGGWKYVNGWGHVVTGFEETIHMYDGNLRYYPPPGFPVGNTYELISWEEVER